MQVMHLHAYFLLATAGTPKEAVQVVADVTEARAEPGYQRGHVHGRAMPASLARRVQAVVVSNEIAQGFDADWRLHSGIEARPAAEGKSSDARLRWGPTAV